LQSLYYRGEAGPDCDAGDPIDLTGADLILGSDASLAAVVIDDPSVGGMHARIIRQADGGYLVRDQGSVAGTWVNFELVPEDGRLLRQGDRIQLGRVEFRFRLPGDAPTREIKVYPEDSGSDSA
jgi:predicted component of type VI protein secretion system